MKWDRISERLIEIESWARDGNSEKEIIKMLGISPTTWTKYKKEHSELRDALNRGYEFSLPKVIPALFRAAIGYKYDETTQERDKNGNLVTTKIVTKEVAPNVSAIMNILKNKYPQEWNMVDKLEIKTDSKVKDTLDAMSAEELLAILNDNSEEEEDE